MAAVLERRVLIVLALTLLVAVAGCQADSPTDTTSRMQRTQAPLGAHPCNGVGECGTLRFKGHEFLAAAWLDEERMYLSTAAGTVELLDLTKGGLERVASGLSHPRGLVALHGQLYVSHAGDSCQNWAVLADELESAGRLGDDVDVETLRSCYPRRFYRYGDVVREIVLASDGHLSAFSIEPNGSLTNRTLVLDDVPIGGGDHGHNGLATDGVWVYGSVGHPRNFSETSLWEEDFDADTMLEPGRKRDLLGTVYRFQPDDPQGTLEVFARGLRNTYGISVGADGTIWGADNDGGTDQLEELNVIRFGHHYGYPDYGTYKAPSTAGMTEPFRLVPGDASTFALASEDGVYYAYGAHRPGYKHVVDFTTYDGLNHRRVFDRGDRWATALLEKDGLLYIISYDGSITTVDPEHSSKPISEVSVAIKEAKQDGIYGFEPQNLAFRVGEIAAVDFQPGRERHALSVEGLEIFEGLSDGLPIDNREWSRPRFEHLFEKPGEYRFVCLIHEAQGMSGIITVSE